MNYAMSQGYQIHLKYIENKKNNVAGKVLLLEYEIPISFQASVTTDQGNFFKIHNFFEIP